MVAYVGKIVVAELKEEQEPSRKFSCCHPQVFLPFLLAYYTQE